MIRHVGNKPSDKANLLGRENEGNRLHYSNVIIFSDLGESKVITGLIHVVLPFAFRVQINQNYSSALKFVSSPLWTRHVLNTPLTSVFSTRQLGHTEGHQLCNVINNFRAKGSWEEDLSHCLRFNSGWVLKDRFKLDLKGCFFFSKTWLTLTLRTQGSVCSTGVWMQ